jgi:hypothetical protein
MHPGQSLDLGKPSAFSESGLSKPPAETTVIRILNTLNLVALLACGVILIAAAAVRRYQLEILLPIIVVVITVYWLLRKKTGIVACGLGISICLGGWILFCENIVRIDNLLGTRLLLNLHLGPRLMSYAAHTVKGAKAYRECCGDSLTYNLTPGSNYTDTYDCDECSPLYQVVADETGYLNQDAGLIKNGGRIDLFLAGDSVMQGMGVPGVLEFIKDRIPGTEWNLSMAGYGPRQKVNAILTYALPNKPRWLVLEFFSGNDVTDAIESQVCTHEGFRGLINKNRVRRRLMANPVYASMLAAPGDRFELFEDYVEDSLTLAASRYYIDRLKSLLKSGPVSNPASGGRSGTEVPVVSLPATTDYDLAPEQRLQWARVGMQETHAQYQRLLAKIAEMQTKPEVILLYDPAGYEIYRDILVSRRPELDQVSAFQIQAQKDFAQAHGWRFLDLTTPLRTELERSKAWIYGQHDSTHWSHDGTTIVAGIMADELLTVMGR